MVIKHSQHTEGNPTSVEPGRTDSKNETDSWSSQLYSEPQMTYTLNKKDHLSKVYNHKGKPHVARACFSIEAYKQITTASCDE